jgi:asparagine synthase (glutamine-hydrolysing)
MLYRELSSYWPDPSCVVVGAQNEDLTWQSNSKNLLHLADFVHVMRYLDMLTYLPDDILAKVDRAAMAVSLETRIPLLDHRVVEFAWKLPLSMNIDASRGKTLLRKILQRYVPPDLIERPKKGFSVPLNEWLRGALRPWAEELLSESRLRQEGYFEARPICKRWSEHVSGKHNWQAQLWGLLMFEAWLEHHSSKHDTSPDQRRLQIGFNAEPAASETYLAHVQTAS